MPATTPPSLRYVLEACHDAIHPGREAQEREEMEKLLVEQHGPDWSSDPDLLELMEYLQIEGEILCYVAQQALHALTSVHVTQCFAIPEQLLSLDAAGAVALGVPNPTVGLPLYLDVSDEQGELECVGLPDPEFDLGEEEDPPMLTLAGALFFQGKGVRVVQPFGSADEPFEVDVLPPVVFYNPRQANLELLQTDWPFALCLAGPDFVPQEMDDLWNESVLLSRYALAMVQVLYRGGVWAAH